MRISSLTLALSLLLGVASVLANPSANVRAWQELSNQDINLIADAIYHAEGGERAKKPFGILSVRCDGYKDCRGIAVNTIRSNFRRWSESRSHEDFLTYLARVYAPETAVNDPTGLNRNWVKNVTYFVNHPKPIEV